MQCDRNCYVHSQRYGGMPFSLKSNKVRQENFESLSTSKQENDYA